MTSALNFFREALGELKKSTWLTRKEATGSTLAVVALVGLVALYVAGIDFILSIFFGAVLGR